MNREFLVRSKCLAGLIGMLAVAWAGPTHAVPLTMDVTFLSQTTGAFSFTFDDSTDLGVSRPFALESFSWLDVYGRQRVLGDVTSFSATVTPIGTALVANPYTILLADYTRPCNIGVAGSCTETLSTSIRGITTIDLISRFDYCEIPALTGDSCLLRGSSLFAPSLPITSGSFSTRPAATSVPEPSSLALLVGGVMLLAGMGRKRLPRP